jgi:sugar phosphate isomerase/epimerase
MKSPLLAAVVVGFLACRSASPASPASAAGAADYQLFARSNLLAWCIVPFDARKRAPEERAAMLHKLGFEHFAYDYRAEHIPSFETEIQACQRHRVSLDAWWFPTSLNEEARHILDLLQRHHLRTQLWITGAGGPTKSPEEQRARVDAEATRLRPIAEAASRIGCTIALYNHGNWFGEPENQLQVLERLRQQGATDVGLVYNQHHGHEHLDRFAELLNKMKPHLLALNLNGMSRDTTPEQKIVPLGQGTLDLELLRIIRNSGWHGPLGILNHTDEDAEARLLDNLQGLDWLVAQLDGKPPGPKPKPRTWKLP